MLSRKLCASLLGVSLLTGCGTPKVQTVNTANPIPRFTALRELPAEEFGTAVSTLLRSDRRGGKAAELATAIVRRQFARARQYFERGEREAGLATVRGALFLVRSGELRPAMCKGASGVLVEAAAEASRLGSEGRARALYSLLKQSEPSPGLIQSTDEHLVAMDRFAERSGKENALERIGDEQRVAVERSIYEPLPEHVDLASRKITEWINAALVSDVLDRWGEAAFDREEAIEAYRARRFGALTMVATHLRQGDPMGALDWLEKGDMARLAPADLRSRLEQAGQDDDATAWGGLYQFFQADADPNRADSSIGSELAEVAAFGAATELFRSHPKELAAVGPLALLLPEYQLGEAVPFIIRDALGETPQREELSWALSLVMRALLVHGEAGDLDSVRRIQLAAERLFAYAEQQEQKGMLLRPNPSRIFRTVASFESRFSDLDRARVALVRALTREPSVLGYVELSRIERQRGDLPAALVSLTQAQAKGVDDTLGSAEALTVRYELLSDQGDSRGADQSLREALRAAMGARDRAQRPVEQAQAERRFARILEHYGKFDGAERASKRALEASRSDVKQLSATILDSARRALVFDDIRASRRALRDALEYGLNGEDCVYVALWLRVLERRRQLPSDGTVEDLWARLGDLAYWPAQLRAWAQGQLTADELGAAARREPERVEAKFYRALFQSTGPVGDELLKVLSTVADSRTVGLVEVAVAQDLRRRAAARPLPLWPSGVTIP